MEERTLKDEIKDLTMAIKGELDKTHSKKFKPAKATISKAKLKKGYIVVVEFRENKSVNMTKTPIINGTIKVGDTYHAVRDLDVFYFERILGKPIPMIFQAKNKINPYNPIDGRNETYGQAYIKARLIADTIKDKKPMSIGLIIIVFLIIGGAIWYFTKK